MMWSPVSKRDQHETGAPLKSVRLGATRVTQHRRAAPMQLWRLHLR